METQGVTPQAKKRRVRIRRRSLVIQLESALRDAEAAMTADISVQKLVQTRLAVLTTMQARERHDKLKRALAEVERLTAENEKLKQDLAAALAVKPAVRPMTDIERTLAQYEASKQNGGQQ